MSMNNKRAPFDDIRVRQAVAHAINRQDIIDGAMFGSGTPIGTFFAPHNPAYVDLMFEYCKKLLSWRMQNDENTLSDILLGPDGAIPLASRKTPK